MLASTACAAGGGDVLSVNDWTLSREAFTEQLQQIADNEGYVAARSANGEPFEVMRAGTEEFDPDFVAEFLNERITFRLAEAEVAKRGLTVTDEDRQKAIDTIVAGPGDRLDRRRRRRRSGADPGAGSTPPGRRHGRDRCRAPTGAPCWTPSAATATS